MRKVLNSIKNQFKCLVKIIYQPKSVEYKKLNYEEYESSLLSDKYRARKAFELAWITRNFEVELYWKRATYFWAMLASCFVGYFALINSDNFHIPDKNSHVEVYFIICIGITISIAFFLMNKGSKMWQSHWEAHVDLLEDSFTGPLYKTVNKNQSYSVTRLNEIVSFVILVIWIILGIKYLFDHDLMDFDVHRKINFYVLITSVIEILVIVSMFYGYGRGKFSHHRFEMYRRKII